MFTEELTTILVNRSINPDDYEKYDSNFEQMYNFTLYDKNSSKLKEFITSEVANCSILPEKHGRDCISIDNILKEIKPETFYNKTSKRGTGHFSDYSFSRLEKDLESNLKIINSLFYKRHLIYSVEFPITEIKDTLYNQLHTQCVLKGNRYCRRCGWDYKDWINSNNLIFNFVNKRILVRYKLRGINIVCKPLFDRLLII